MKILSVCPKSFAANTYILISDKEAFIVDPSVSVNAVERLLAEEKALLRGILLTHGHFDHTVSIDTLRDKLHIPLIMHGGDAPMLTDGKINGFYDFYGQESVHRTAQTLVKDGDIIPLGNESIKVISTPGHSPGSVCFLCPDTNGKQFLITGDTLFSNTVGRCDLWGGDESAIVRSLASLRKLDQNMVIYPGHGPSHVLGKALEVALYYTDF